MIINMGLGGRNMSKRNTLITLLLFCVILIEILPAIGVFPVYAAEIVGSGNCGDEESNITWTLDDTGSLVFSGTGKMVDLAMGSAPWKHCYVPNTKDRFPITKVQIENGITKIATAAFYDCFELISISIPDSVLSIDWATCSHCVNLREVKIGNSVSFISSAFHLKHSKVAET